MSFVEFASSPAVQALGLTILHSLWQGLLIGGVVAAGFAAMHNSSARARYLLGVLGMVVMMITPIVTFFVTLGSAEPPTGTTIPGRPGAPVSFPALSPLFPWLAALWLAGFSFLQLRVAVDWLRARRMSRVLVTDVAPSWSDMVREIADRVGLRRAVRILESSLVAVPCVVGYLKPVILLPAGLLNKLPGKQIQALIAHELAHIVRHDYVINLIQGLFESLLFFHPATWWLSNRIRLEREFCCDDVALEVCGSPRDYGQALLSLDELRDAEARLVLASTGGSLMKRVSRFCRAGGEASPGPGRLMISMTLAAIVAVVLSVTGIGCGDNATDVTKTAEVSEPNAVTVEPAVAAVVARINERIRLGSLTTKEATHALQEALSEIEHEGASRQFITLVKETDESGAVIPQFRLKKIAEGTGLSRLHGGEAVSGGGTAYFMSEDGKTQVFEFKGDGSGEFSWKDADDESATWTFDLSDDLSAEDRAVVEKTIQRVHEEMKAGRMTKKEAHEILMGLELHDEHPEGGSGD